MNHAREALTRAVNRAIAEGAPVYVNQPAVERVQMPAWSDDWMKGDRFGNLVRVTKDKRTGEEIGHVLLDKSNKVRRVRLLDLGVV